MKHALLFLTLLAGSAFADTGAVTTNPPTYIPGANGNLSLAPNGGLRIEGNASGTPVPISGSISTSPAAPSTAGPTNVTSTQCVQLTSLQSQAVVMVDVSGTYTGSLVAHAIGPASTTGILFRPRANGVAASYTLTAQTGLFTVDTAGATSMEVCGSTVATGTAVVSLRTNTGAEDSLDPLMKLPGTAGAPSALVITTQDLDSATGANYSLTGTGTLWSSCALSSYKSVIVKMVSNASGNTVQMQDSIDNTYAFTYPDGSGHQTSGNGQAQDATSTTSSVVELVWPKIGPCMRLQVTAGTGLMTVSVSLSALSLESFYEQYPFQSTANFWTQYPGLSTSSTTVGAGTSGIIEYVWVVLQNNSRAWCSFAASASDGGRSFELIGQGATSPMFQLPGIVPRDVLRCKTDSAWGGAAADILVLAH